MGLTLVTDITSDPVSLDEVKDHLRLDIDEDDAYVSGCISAARQWVEGQTKRSLMPATYDYKIDYGWPWARGDYRIELPLSPVTAVSSVKYIDDQGAEQTLASSQYTAVLRKYHSFIVPAYNVALPVIRNVPEAITVRFTVGDADEIPQPLHRAVMVLAGAFYEDREGMGIPEAVEALVSPYRRSAFR